MSAENSLRQYQLLFGALDFRDGDAARTVVSPAAYLADLLRLLDDEGLLDDGGPTGAEGPLNGASTLRARRPDIWEIPLDGEHTFTEAPYLDIVVEILERLAGPDAYERLRTMRFPFDKPFNLAYETLGGHLKNRAIGRDERHRLIQATASTVAAEHLGLSPEMIDVVTVARPEVADLRQFYHLAVGEDLEVLEDVERFTRTVGLNEIELNQLLAGRYVNQHDGVIQVRGGRLVGGLYFARNDWYDRVNRFVRLARRTGMTFPDLDLVLSTCCGNRLDAAAPAVLAAVRHVSATMDIPVDVACALAAPMSADLLARAFDGRTVAEGLGIGEAALARLTERLREAYTEEIDLSALHRAARFMNVLGLSADELLDLLPLVDASFPIPYATTRTIGDWARVLAAPDPASGLWLAQTLPALVAWLRATGLSVADLTAFLGGPAEVVDTDALATAIEMTPDLFVSQRFSSRASRAIHDALTTGADAYDALTGLGQVSAADFMGLGLGDRLANKIFANLVLRGDLAADGTLVRVPRELGTDFSAYQDKVQTLVDMLGGAFFPSDLADLPGLSPAQRTELYDNLLHNGYVAGNGDVRAEFGDINARLDDVTRPVIALIRSSAARYDTEPLPIDLPFELDGLLDNLRFNGHIDDDNCYVRKDTLAALDVADFTLAPEFAPYRRDILGAVQDQIAAHKAALRTFPPEAFAEIADRAAAQRALDEGDPADPVTRGRIHAIELEQRPYRVDPAAVDRLGLKPVERDALLDLLVDRGDLDENLTVPRERLDFFAWPTNVLNFHLPGMEDYSGDVFDLLHPVAVELEAGTEEIDWTLATFARRRESELLTVATGVFGVPTAVISAICDGMGVDLGEMLAEPGPDLRRVRAFARFAAKLGLDAASVALVFDDRDLAGHFPEPLALPSGVTRVDALLDSADGYAYLFAGDHYWRYQGREIVDSAPLSALNPALTSVDAAFAHPDGTDWIVSGTRSYVRRPDSTRWVPREQPWGRVRDEFATGVIRAAAVDEEGRTYLFCGEQYVRYSGTDFSAVDEGFPRPAAEFGEDEDSRVEAGFHGRDGRTYLLSGPRPGDWGRAPVAFDGVPDAAYADATGVYVFSGAYVTRHTDALENEGVRADEGFPKKIEAHFPNVPAEFESGLDAAFADADGLVHLFKDGRTVALTAVPLPLGTAERWGARREAFPSHRVDAAFVGLDGRTYLFSGDSYLRYSGADYARADLGYPRPIAPDWGGLTTVDASFTLDGETYLFGGGQYVRYSTADYTTPDEDHPKPLPGDWWNLPDGFTDVDAVFTAGDGRTYLFSGDRFVIFDARRRWWSKPKTLAEEWDSIPFASVDAAFAGRDGRTYVFSQDRYVRYSTSDFSEVDDRYPAPVAAFWGKTRDDLARTGRVDAALQLDGRTYLFAGDQFTRFTGQNADPGYPRALSALKDEPRLANVPATLGRVDAAFADKGSVYLYEGTTCHVVSDSLYRRHDAPDVTCAYLEDGAILAEGAGGWRRQGAVEALGDATGPARSKALRDLPELFRFGVDAVLHGTDGTTYVFKGDACYDTSVDREYPVAQAWGRPRTLGAVDAGFVGRDGVTYLFSGGKFTRGGQPERIADHWGGLTGVAIAYVWKDTTYLFEHPDEQGRMRYVVYSGRSYDRPDAGFPRTADASIWNAERVPRAVVVAGDTLVLLDADTYTLPDGSLPRPVSLLWRGFEGELTSAYVGADGATYFFFDEQCRRHADGVLGPPAPLGGDSFARVDAAFTHDGHTYLFSGTRYARYARYATDEYAYCDPGYPKPIAGNLRAEFPGLAESFEDDLTTVDKVEAAVANGRNLYLFMGGRCHVASRELTATYDRPAGRERPFDGPIDAAFVLDRRTYLLSGAQYIRYTGDDYTHADDGYPRAIATSLAADLGVPPLPEAFLDGVDAGFAAGGGIHLFKGGRHLRADAPETPSPDWGHVRSAFDGGLDAALVLDDGLYAFRGDQFARYSGDALTTLEYADTGYPRTIDDDWGDLPAAFEAAVDGAFTLEGAAYFTKGAEYVRHPGGPVRAITDGWADTADYRLADLHAIARYAGLDRATGGALTDALTASDEDPYATMAKIFGWDPAELMWAQRTLPQTGIAFVLAAVDLFALARRYGVPPSGIAAVTGDPVVTLKRDALLTAVLAGAPDLADSGDLFERLLIDVDMGARGVTSRVREAIAAVQLYVHRCLLDLEPGEERARERLGRWWRWMRNYRVWEANRKVYLYPENYLRPELRDTKTPAFAELESDLLRGGVTSATAQRAYTRYLDEYTEVSRLTITGGYVSAASADGFGPGEAGRELVLVGRTRTDPHRHYHRLATFRDGASSATWGPWLKVDVQIDAERVHPVRAFDRVFLFWAAVEPVRPERSGTGTIVATKVGDRQEVSAPAVKHQVKIYYSFRNLNGEWVPVQELAAGTPIADAIGEVTLAVRTGPLPGTEHQAITVSYTAQIPKGTIGASHALTPELYAVPVPGVVVPPQAGDVTTIFDETIDPESVTWFERPAGFADGAWFSVDHKGGSFLCHPILPAAEDTPESIPFKGNSGVFPSWDRIDAAFELPDGAHYFFDNTGKQYGVIRPGRTKVERMLPIAERWGRTVAYQPPPDPSRKGDKGHHPLPPWKDQGARWERVDTAWVDGDHLFMTSGPEIVRYTLAGSEVPDVVDAGYPQALPRPLTAVFRGHALSGDAYATPGEWLFRPVAGAWGDLPGDLTGAFETTTDVYLFQGARYLTYPKNARLSRPYTYAELPHTIVRLTSSTASKLNQKLLAGGVAALLDTATQETDELPAFDTRFSDAVTIRVRPGRVEPDRLPGRSHLDFASANGGYYWEIFFHAPLLIAQALNAAQRFEEAKTWFEYVFDPAGTSRYWRFLPFLGADPGALADALRAKDDPSLEGSVSLLDALVPVFRGEGELTEELRAQIHALTAYPQSEEMAVAAELDRHYDQMGDRPGQLQAHRDDPFDPHAIAALRPDAYRRSAVAAYIDNLIDWGDLLFRQYTMESVDEARMLYILAWDLLGTRPRGLEAVELPATRPLSHMEPYDAGQDLPAIHSSTRDPYFWVPMNPALGGYWDLVADRLTKIRASLDIMGVSRPLPLFEPEIDPMTLVRRAALGTAADTTPDVVPDVPHYRFAYAFRRAQELADRVRDFGGALLDAIERRDAEALTLLQNTQESTLLTMTVAVKEAQVTMAAENLASLEAGEAAAQQRIAHYTRLIAQGISPWQQGQLAMLSTAAAAHFTSSGLRVGAAVAAAFPDILAGPFIMGTKAGGSNTGEALSQSAEVAEALGEGFSVLGEVLGVRAEIERQAEDWELQLGTAEGDAAQITRQIVGGRAQLAAAERELGILRQEIAGKQEVAVFLTSKFGSAELYQWMSGRLSGLYFQAYGLAYEAARVAERAWQFERGATEQIVLPVHWDSLRNGLLAGHGLQHDLDRLGRAHMGGDTRRLEITRKVSLLELDPLAVVSLRDSGTCEFALTEEFFDHDFPGDYRRQLRGMALTFTAADGSTLTVNAALTQLSHKTVLTPDPKAVQYLLDGKGAPPATVRPDWRAGQRIALSHVAEGWDNNGLHELRYDDDRYLPFEGTGAVSTWRLDLPGLRSADHPADLSDVQITIRYTAEHGGDTFANTVRGLLKPYAAARYVDVPTDFPDEWAAFTHDLVLPVTLPDLYGGQITGIYPAYTLTEEGAAELRLTGGPTLPAGRLTPTPGLNVNGGIHLTLSGARETLTGLGLVITYRAGLR
ncbi:hemopexin repeat-containing protein [Nonomuraea sp. NPDC049269]|uniref:Tc toxin subunit A-related protein n=1 Tax=Nonomuraea sp. NPDC049269 TaxID=3364349 RepID=UPI0037185041